MAEEETWKDKEERIFSSPFQDLKRIIFLTFQAERMKRNCERLRLDVPQQTPLSGNPDRTPSGNPVLDHDGISVISRKKTQGGVKLVFSWN